MEALADQICGALDGLKETTKDINKITKDQGEMLKKTNSKAEETEAQLTKDNSDLKNVLAKHKGGKQICFDICLVMTWLILIGILIKIL